MKSQIITLAAVTLALSNGSLLTKTGSGQQTGSTVKHTAKDEETPLSQMTFDCV